MRFKISFLFLFFIYSGVFATQTSLEEMRALYKQAASSEDACSKLIKCCNNQSTYTEAIILGYKGCATIMMANHLINPFSKWSKFSSGREMLEQAISKDSTNIELRYLRFTIQTKAPSFLGYHNNISSDKLFLLKEINKLKDMQLNKLIVRFLAQSD